MTTRQLGRLFQAHKENISKQRGIQITGSVNTDDLEKVSNRAALVTVLDIVLELHRAKCSSYLSPLRGRKALTHLLLTKFNWPIATINQMSIADSILAIQDELVSPEPHELVKQLLDNVSAQYLYDSFADIPDFDWDPLIHEQYLRLRE